MRLLFAALGLLFALPATAVGAPRAPAPLIAAEVLAQSKPEEWRRIEAQNLLVMRLASGGEVLIELADFAAPQTLANIRTLVRQAYFDGLAVLRVQDNYVTQWGDPLSGKPEAKPLGQAKQTIPPEWSVPRSAATGFTALPDPDVYAREAGVWQGFPAGRDKREAWLAHCYGMVGVGRDNAPESGSGQELYVVIGHAPRHLDRNITLVGRVLEGMQHLSALPRGSGPAGFYTEAEAKPGLASVRLASELSEAPQLEALRSDSASFAALVEARRNRREPWFHRPAGGADVCNVLLPVRRVR